MDEMNVLLANSVVVAIHGPKRMLAFAYLCGEHYWSYNSQSWDNAHGPYLLTYYCTASTCPRSSTSLAAATLFDTRVLFMRTQIAHSEAMPASNVSHLEYCMEADTYYAQRKYCALVMGDGDSVPRPHSTLCQLLKFFHEIVIMRKAPLLISTHSFHEHIMRLRAKWKTLFNDALLYHILRESTLDDSKHTVEDKMKLNILLNR